MPQQKSIEWKKPYRMFKKIESDLWYDEKKIEKRGTPMLQFTKIQRILLIALAVFVGALLGLLAMALAKQDAPAPAAIAADAPIPTAEFSIIPEPTPEPRLIFLQSVGSPLPADGYRHNMGDAFPIGGRVCATQPITAVTVSVTCAYNNDGPLYPYRPTVHMKEGSTALVYDLTDANTVEGVSLADMVDFSQFTAGVHTLKIVASCEGLKSQTLFTTRFYVHGTEWLTMKKKEFGGNYESALAFFGDKERFMYRYQWVNGRYTLADPDWEETYITTVEGLPAGETWRVHVDAVPYVEKAIEYMQTTFVRVSGTNGDSGIVRLDQLVKTYNGAYVSRFTSSLKKLSHHGFGTAIDINAAMAPNLNNAENNEVIPNDVKGHLTYNGIVTAGGLSYYDYTYSGEYPEQHLSVPETCINYLLYELAFYRAGFLWGHYYNSTSDAMHFTLCEDIYGSHDGKLSLRKVYAYAEPMHREP